VADDETTTAAAVEAHLTAAGAAAIGAVSHLSVVDGQAVIRQKVAGALVSVPYSLEFTGPRTYSATFDRAMFGTDSSGASCSDFTALGLSADGFAEASITGCQ
jgi:hypothetical protein